MSGPANASYEIYKGSRYGPAPHPFSSYEEIVVADNPLGYWRMEDASGSLVPRVGGISLAPQGSGQTYQQPGFKNRGYGVMFSGNGRFEAPSATNFAVTTGTIEAWIKTTNAGTSYRGIVAKQFAYGMFLRDNRLIIHNWGGGGDKDTTIFPNDGLWHHVAFTFDSANDGLIYHNGELVLDTTNNVVNQTVTFQVGDGNASQYWNGTIDEVAVYDRQLSLAEIQEHYAG